VKKLYSLLILQLFFLPFLEASEPAFLISHNDYIEKGSRELSVGFPLILPSYSFGMYKLLADNTEFKSRHYESYQYLLLGYGGTRFDEPSNMIPYLWCGKVRRKLASKT
jgi:hypothetical protein